MLLKLSPQDEPPSSSAAATGGTADENALLSVYQELRRLAAYHLNQERRNHTLQATALVHEAYLRLIELIALVRLCSLNRAAVRFYEQAFIADPSLDEDLGTGHRYNAACVAESTYTSTLP